MLELGARRRRRCTRRSRGDLRRQRVDLVFRRRAADARACSTPLPAAMRGRLGRARPTASARAAARERCAAGDVVMVKGSNGSRMGPLVAALKQRFAPRATATGAEDSAMLTWLADFSPHLQPAQPVPLPHVPHARGGGDGAVLRLLLRPAHHRGAAAQAGQGPADPRRRARLASADQEGHAHDGRPDDPVRACSSRRCCGPTSTAPMSGSCCSSRSASALIGFYDDYLKVTKQIARRLLRPRAARAAKSLIARDRLLSP